MAEVQFWADFAKACALTLVAEAGGGILVLAAFPTTFSVYSAVFLGCAFGLIPMTLISVELGLFISHLLSGLLGGYVPLLFFFLFAIYCFSSACQYHDNDKENYYQLPRFHRFERDLNMSWLSVLGNALCSAMWLELGAKSQLGVMALASNLNYKALLLGCGTAQACILLLARYLGSRVGTINAKQRLISIALGTLAITYGLLSVIGFFISTEDDGNGGPAIDPVTSKPA